MQKSNYCKRNVAEVLFGILINYILLRKIKKNRRYNFLASFDIKLALLRKVLAGTKRGAFSRFWPERGTLLYAHVSRGDSPSLCC